MKGDLCRNENLPSAFVLLTSYKTVSVIFGPLSYGGQSSQTNKA